MRKFLSLFLALAMSIACCTLAAAEDTAEAMQYTEENITIDAGDHQIPATLTVPVGAEGEKFFLFCSPSTISQSRADKKSRLP